MTTPPPPKKPVLEVSNLSTEFVRGADRKLVVRDVSLSLELGRTLMLLGESGSGKSVTARSILQLYGSSVQTSGSVKLHGKELLGLPEKELNALRGARLSLIPQDPTGALDPLRRIGPQIAEVMRAHRVQTSRAAALRRAEELLSLVGIHETRRVARSFPHELSGGMRQRVVIAIAISCDPEVIVADEPTTALDVTVQAQILDLISRLREEIGTAVLMITHDVGVAADYGDEIRVMYRGGIVDSGPAPQCLNHPRHPYTAALVAAQPRPGVPKGSLPVITPEIEESFALRGVGECGPQHQPTGAGHGHTSENGRSR